MNIEVVELLLIIGIYPLLILVGILFIVPFLLGLIDHPKHRSSVPHRIRK